MFVSIESLQTNPVIDLSVKSSVEPNMKCGFSLCQYLAGLLLTLLRSEMYDIFEAVMCLSEQLFEQ